MRYAKGIETRKHIFQIAKELMYTHGYKKTTYSMIAQEAEVPVGLVNYYFKKNDLIDEIYEQFIDEIELLIVNQAGDRVQNGLQSHIVLSGIMLTQIYSDPRILDLQVEVTGEGLLTSRIHHRFRLRLMEVLSKYPSELSLCNEYWYVNAEYGARRELILNNRHLLVGGDEFNELRDLLSTISARLRGIPYEIILDNLSRANEILESLDYSHIKLL